MVKPVDDVQHRGFARAIRADDRADFALADIEADAVQGADAAKIQRDVLDGKENFGEPPTQSDPLDGSDLRRDQSFGRVHSAASSSGCEAGMPGMAFPSDVYSGISTMRTTASIVPLRPSSKVTAVAMCFSFDPS